MSGMKGVVWLLSGAEGVRVRGVSLLRGLVERGMGAEEEREW